jgi:hypothetical protein
MGCTDSTNKKHKEPAAVQNKPLAPPKTAEPEQQAPPSPRMTPEEYFYSDIQNIEQAQ